MELISKTDFLEDYERGLICDIIVIGNRIYGRSMRGEDAPKVVYAELGP